MSIYKNRRHGKSIDEMAELPERIRWDDPLVWAKKEEKAYVKCLKGQDLIDYVKQREEEYFLEKI